MSEPVFSVFIEGNPVPAQRPRVNTRQKRAYTPTKYGEYKKYGSSFLRIFWKGKPPLTGALSIDVDIVLPRPKSRPRKGSLHRKFWTPEGSYLLPCRGDIDNYAKTALDCLTQGGVIQDDHLVVELNLTKKAGAIPGLKIVIRELPQPIT